MFWKLITLSLLLWAAGMYFSVTLGGLIHLVPAAAIVCIVFRRMTERPDTEFGRWRPATERAADADRRDR
jgi:F0F1-type ATP synthase assembly protein I